MESQPQRIALARQWRPKNFATVVGQEHVVRALSNALDHNILHHAYLFTGTRGVGKTTLARILAKCLNCEAGISASPCGSCEHCLEIDSGRFPDLYEIDAASRTKVEDTREILDNIPYAPVKGRCKIYLIDEVHMLSNHSFNALLKTLEEPPEHVKFLLATTDPQKLPATVLSRCLQFHLGHLAPSQITEHLSHILLTENIPFDTEAIELLANAAQGSVRDALSLLHQAIAYGNQSIQTADIKNMLGTIDQEVLLEILQALQERDANALLACSHTLANAGADFHKAINDLLSILHKISIAQLAPDALDTSARAPLAALADTLNAEDVQLYYQIALLGQKDISIAPNTQIGFEMTLLRMLTFTPLTANARVDMAPATVIKTASAPAATVAKSTTTPPPAIQANPEWTELIKQMALPGATSALLSACALEELTSDQLRLSLAPSHEALLNQKHIDRINAALAKCLNPQVRVQIEVQDSRTPTANDIVENRQNMAKKEAKASLLADKNVQSLMTQFEANVINDSITTPIDN